MTKNEIIKIKTLRMKGAGYSQISEELEIPVNTVSSYCRRNGLDRESLLNTRICKNCSGLIIIKKSQKPKKFCSDKCRTTWWNSHQDEVNKKAVYEFTCVYCGAEFTAYGNSKRKYCSHACYIKARYSVGGTCDE